MYSTQNLYSILATDNSSKIFHIFKIICVNNKTFVIQLFSELNKSLLTQVSLQANGKRFCFRIVIVAVCVMPNKPGF